MNKLIQNLDLFSALGLSVIAWIAVFIMGGLLWIVCH